MTKRILPRSPTANRNRRSVTRDSWPNFKPMGRYDLVVKPSVPKDLRGIPREDVRRILARMETLRDDPRPPGAEKLSAQEQYRVRQGNYRIVYAVSDATLTVQVVKVGHRREVYRER